MPKATPATNRQINQGLSRMYQEMVSPDPNEERREQLIQARKKKKKAIAKKYGV